MAVPHQNNTLNGKQESISDRIIKEAEIDDIWDKGSVTRSYHRMRVEKLPGYIEGLKERDKEKLKKDATRIRRSHDRLSKSEDGKRLLIDIRKAFTTWRDDAEDRGVKFKHCSRTRAQHWETIDFVKDDVDLDESSEMDEDPSYFLLIESMFSKL